MRYTLKNIVVIFLLFLVGMPSFAQVMSKGKIKYHSNIDSLCGYKNIGLNSLPTNSNVTCLANAEIIEFSIFGSHGYRGSNHYFETPGGGDFPSSILELQKVKSIRIAYCSKSEVSENSCRISVRSNFEFDQLHHLQYLEFLHNGGFTSPNERIGLMKSIKGVALPINALPLSLITTPSLLFINIEFYNVALPENIPEIIFYQTFRPQLLNNKWCNYPKEVFDEFDGDNYLWPLDSLFSNNSTIPPFQKDTVFSIYFNSGVLAMKGELVKGFANGQFKIFHTNGNVKEIRNYDHGVEHGLWTKYSQYGDLISKVEYDRGMQQGVKHQYYVRTDSDSVCVATINMANNLKVSKISECNNISMDEYKKTTRQSLHYWEE